MTYSIIKEFFTSGYCNNESELVNQLSLFTREEMCELIITLDQKPIDSSTIPQYSSFEDGTINLIEYLKVSGNFGPSFVEVGKHYLEYGHKECAYIKYGENHSKLSQIMRAVTIEKEGRKRVYLSDLGYEISNRSKEEQHDCFVKLGGLIPIVQYAIKNDIKTDKELEKVLNNYLSPSTALRRRKNTWYLIMALKGGVA